MSARVPRMSPEAYRRRVRHVLVPASQLGPVQVTPVHGEVRIAAPTR
jgi:hypothetical protein